MKKILTRIPRGTYLLISILLFIFVLPVVIDDSHKDLVYASFYSIILLSISSIIGEKKVWALITILCAVCSIWLMYFIDEKSIKYIAFSFSILIFTATVITMISQIIKKKDVDGHLIIETINGYLLIGVIISFINSTVLWHNNQAITFPEKIGLTDIGDIVYYSFVSMTTIGFGEIVPQSQIAKSISIFSGIVGQFYLAIIMALIIGKLLNSKHRS
ncbi:ion channel [Ancylomarina sp.]|uniref:ion channel n=1 Tax=Ancylomarina sp. TaxID=1970196 RepID=UPI0035699A47